MSAHQAGRPRISSTMTKKNPRPRKYATASERQAAYRARAPEVCFRAEAKTVETLDRIAETLDQPRADLLLSMTKFALANHDWARFGLTHRPLPYGYGLAEQEFIGPRQANPQPIWKRTRPKSLGKPVPLTPKQKAEAKKRAAAAGRKYPNLVDNIAASRLKNPTMPTIYTVKSEYLIADAEKIEKDAKESLNAWILLGQSEKYSEAMKTANMLRQAAATKNMTTRREILRNAGFTVKTPKQTTSSLEGESRKENPTMKKPTPAQLAARAKFAEMARSGAFKRKKNPTAKAATYYVHANLGYGKSAHFKVTATPGANSVRSAANQVAAHLGYPVFVSSRNERPTAEGLPVVRYEFVDNDQTKAVDLFVYPAKREGLKYVTLKSNPTKRKKTVSEKISQLVREGYPQKQAVAVALSEQRAGKVKATPRKRNPITETLIYGLAPGETRDYMEELLYAGGLKLTPEQIQKVLNAATAAGYHSFRVTGFDPTVGAAFVRTMGQTRQRKTNPATGRKGSGTKLNPMAPAARSPYSSNYKFSVEAKRLIPGGAVFEPLAGFQTKAQAQDYANAILASHPGVTLRIKSYK